MLVGRSSRICKNIAVQAIIPTIDVFLCCEENSFMEDPFIEFAEHYDRMVEENRARTDFFRTLFQEHGVASVLDCACGTGNDLIMAHSLGVEVYGSDVSEPMLDQARKKLSHHGYDIPLKNIDFRDLSKQYSKRFDAVLCLTTSLPQLLDEGEIVRALKSMRQVLTPKGMLVLTQGLTDGQLQSQVRFAPAVNDPDFSRIMVVDYYDEVYDVNILDLTHTPHNNDFKVYSVRYRILLQDDYEKLLKLAGFSRTAYYGDWDFRPYDKEDSEILIVLGFR
jgi:glycine/sarcosine N-methyltransferase